MHRGSVRTAIWLGLLVTVGYGCAGDVSDREAVTAAPTNTPEADTKVAGDLRAKVLLGEPTIAIVTLDETRSEAATRLAVGDMLSEESRPLVAVRKDDYRRMKARALDAPGLRIVDELVELPTSVIEVSSPEALDALERSADVLSVQPEGSFTPQMSSSLDKIESPEANLFGYRGAGATVAVIDTGVDYTMPSFGGCTAPSGTCGHGVCDIGGPLVSGCDSCVTTVCAANPACCNATTGNWTAACFAAAETLCAIDCNTTNPGGGGFEPGGASCKVDLALDIANADGFKDDTATQFARHGTAVADVIAAVAPNAHIVSLDVFTASSATVNETDVLAALNWVLANRVTYGIKVVNLSFGSGAFTAPCATHNLAAPIEALQAAGVLTVAAAGNDGREDALMGPACIPSVLSVGAVYDSSAATTTAWGCTDSPLVEGNVPCFSNAASFLDLVAPGANVIHPDFSVVEGVANSTSIAAAHTSGVAALVAGAFTATTPAQWEKRLRFGGPFATDPRVLKTYNLLNARGAVDICTLDVSPREASFDDLGGAATVAVDVEPASCSYQVQNAIPWVTLAGGGSGTQPDFGTCPQSLCTEGLAAFDGCSACADAVCAFDGFCCSVEWDGQCVDEVEDFCTPNTCFGGGTTLTGPQVVGYSVPAFVTTLRSGFMSFPASGSSFNDTHTISQGSALGGPQVASFLINANATYATTNIATITSTVTDGTSVSEMCLSSTTTCTAWQRYVSTRTVGLSAGDGTKTIFARFRDDYDNSSVRVSDSIILDTTPPVSGTFTATPSTLQNVLTWSGFSDATSGLATYKLVVATGTTIPANCSTGTVLLAAAPNTQTTFTHGSLTNGTTYNYRLCATDNAGKISTGIGATARPAPEYVAPTGTVTINAGAIFAATGSVTLALAATDASGIGGVCVNQTGLACSAWQTIPASGNLAYTLAAGAGLKTVYVRYRDIYNNVSAPVTDTILLDVQAGAVTAVAADARVTLTWNPTTGAPAGTDGWTVSRSTSTMATCAAGTTIYAGTANTFADTTVTNGVLYYYRACLASGANTSAGREITARPKPESLPPTGTVVIAAGVPYVKLTAVSLAITATDAGGGPIQMCVTNSTVCSVYEPFAATKAWTLVAGSGTKTVRVFLRDQYSNTTTSAQAVKDTIVLDTTPPANGTVSSTVTASSVNLTWSGFSDSQSGLASYKVVWQANTPPASCSAGTVLVDTTTATTFNHTGRAAGTKYGYRVCARDNLANVSSGAVRTVTTSP